MNEPVRPQFRPEQRSIYILPEFSKDKEALREADKLSSFGSNSAASQMRQVAGKTFYLREGVWTDAEFRLEARLPESSIRFSSDDYFALLKQKPRLAAFFALGERVLVVFEGRVYRVTAGQ